MLGAMPQSARSRREISWEEFGALSRQLALALVEKTASAPPDVVVGIARGGSIVGCTLSFLLGVDYYPIRLKKQGGATRVVVPPSRELAGLHVALVDDLSESGDTFRIARYELGHVGATRVTTVALVRRVPGFSPDVWALEVRAKVRFPWAAEQLVEGVLTRRDT
jgi:hypoxanthine phosphoribosyltransferase